MMGIKQVALLLCNAALVNTRETFTYDVVSHC